jgi:transcriptional regulator with XRE-family HTH domain
MPATGGATLRAWRQSRGWDVPQMARQLRRAARQTSQTVAAHDGLVRMIYAWERGDHQLTERYELLYAAALGISLAGLATGPDPQASGEQQAHPSRQDFLRAAGALSLLDVLAGYSRAIPAPAAGTRVDAEMASGLESIMLGYRQVYRSAGAASLLGPVCETLGLLTDLAPSAGA